MARVPRSAFNVPYPDRAESMDRDIRVLVDETLSSSAQSAMLADAALQALNEAKAANRAILGMDPNYETYVDGRKGASIYQVSPTGTIVFEFDILSDLFAWIGEMLTRHSPFRTGRYTASHAFFADGEMVDVDQPIPEADEYSFVNMQPYARKIERGLSPQAPHGVYEVVAALAARRFGNVARIRFSFRTPLGGPINEWANRTKMTGKGRPMSSGTRHEWLRRQPAIVITLRD